MHRLILSLLLLSSPLALAELVIDLTDGSHIIVPVNKDQVQGIRFADPKTPRAPERDERAAETTSAAMPRIWQVGPGRALKYPSDAAKKAKDGNIIEIDAGIYPNDYARWTQNDLTQRGVGGMAHLKSKGLIRNGKAIWITAGDNILIENIEFSGAAVQHTNGAGIRHEGGDLTLRNTFFHDNEFSILSGQRPEATIDIASSRFWNQKRPKFWDCQRRRLRP